MGDDGLDAAVGAIALVDHHVHPALATELSHGELEELITESDRPVPPGTTRFDSQLGIAIRRWCCPVLGLPASAPAQAYVDRRRELGAARVTRRLLRAAGVSQLLIDTGYLRDGMLGLAAMAEAAAAGVAEVVRLESVAEQAIMAGDGSAAGFAERFRGGAVGADGRRVRGEEHRRLPVRAGPRSAATGRRGGGQRRGRVAAPDRRQRDRPGRRPGAAAVRALGRGGPGAAGPDPHRFR